MDTTAMGDDRGLPAEASVPAPDGALDLLASHFEQFYRRVYAYLLHRLFDRELADELTAEAFYRAAAHHNRLYGNERQIEAWLLRTATRLADSLYRRKRLHRLLLGRFVHTRPAAMEDPVAGSDADASRRAVQEVLRELPPGHQSAIVLRYYMQMPVEEMAAVLNCRPETARMRLSRAIQEMRRRLRLRTHNNTGNTR